jgi:hypothetical protein
MNKTLIFLVCTLLSLTGSAQSFIGAWEMYHTNKLGDKLRSVVIFADGYQVLTTYHAETGRFMATNGGTWRLEGDTMIEKVEFDTDNPDRVGSEVRFKVTNGGKILTVVGEDIEMKRIDDGKPGALQGAWLMSGRMRDGKEETRDTSGPRKTMKILSGTRFQWIAYNTETKQFSGTGGGTYTTVNGKYTETLEFFSRDNSRVGTSLPFDYELINGKWHHKGLSSAGEPIHEIWSIREK